MGEEYLLCINNQASEGANQIRVLKLTSGKYKSTNNLVKDQKVKINQILTTVDPLKFVLATDKGLIQITVDRQDKKNVFGKSSYSIRVARFISD